MHTVKKLNFIHKCINYLEEITVDKYICFMS